MSREWSPDDLFEILSDERVRAILIETKKQKRSVQGLETVLDASQSSIYRRVNVMTDCALLEEETKVDEDGHHYSVYKPGFENINICLEEERIDVEANEQELDICLDDSEDGN